MKTFPLKIVTPDGCRFEGEAQMVRLRTIAGDVAVMADHAPYFTAIGMGECRVVMPDGSDRRAACCGGMMTVSGDVQIVAGTFEWAEEIDTARAEAARRRVLAAMETSKEAHLKAALRRAEVRLQVAAEN